jgi:ATP-dependent helicase/nuclease subunit B
MPPRVTVFTGPPSSGKTELLLEQYRAKLAEIVPGAVLWLAPTWRASAAVRDRLLGPNLVGCFRPAIMTFANFAAAVLEASPDPIRPLSGPLKRQLVRRLLDEQNAAGRLKHFRPIVHTSGLVDLVSEFISELKRLEIWPEHFRAACEARGIAAKDEELLEIYQTYQQALREHQLFDAEGSFWSARNWLQQGQRRPFENLQFVVADGFSDFTRTQHEILQILAGRVESLAITLTLEPPPCREDLFAKPLKTLAELRKRHKALEVREGERGERGDGREPRNQVSAFAAPQFGESPENRANKTRAAASSPLSPLPSPLLWPAMAHLERHLFGNPRRSSSAETTDGIEILAAARPIGEMEMVGARIKRLIVEENVKPDEIAVVFRTPQDSRSLAADAFSRLGLPIAWEQGARLDRAPILRTLVVLLKLDLDDWPFDLLLAATGSNYFQPAWPSWREGRTAIALERAIRELQVPQGREALLQELRRTGFQPVDLSSFPRSTTSSSLLRSGVGTQFPGAPASEELPEDAENPSYDVLAALAAAFDHLPQQATLPDWANAWDALARDTGILRDLDWDTDNDANVRQSDALAWKMLLSILSSGDQLAGWLKQRPPELSRNEAFRTLLDILGSERLPASGDETGRVRVLSASSIRSLHVPYLFLAGLSEKSFPPPDREDRLYSEAEYARLVEQNLPLVTRTERNREEMLLFYECVTRATKRLFLSYPALDDAAQPLSPSPFLLEVEQACGKGRIAKIESNDFRPVPKTDQPLSPAEFRLVAMNEALEGNHRCLAGLRQHALTAPGSGLATETGNSDGSIAAARNLFAGLELTMLRQDRERFGPAEGILSSDKSRRLLHGMFLPDRTFGVTELESYARCPYRYLMEKIMKVQPLDELALETDYLERGQTVHEVLAAFHQKVNAARGRPTSPAKLDETEFQQLMQEAIAECLPSNSGNSVRDALREVDRRLIVKWLESYRRQHDNYDRLWADCETPPVPEFFEISFGLTKHASTTLALPEPLELPAGEATVRLSGRIDRVDTGFAANHVIFNIVDYKTGASAKFSPDEFMHGAALQLPIYAIAVSEMFLLDRDAVPWQAGYWFVTKDGFAARQSLKMYHRGENGWEELDPDWENLRSQLGDILGGLVHGIRNGFFPVFNRNERCTSSCPFSTICRINQIRSLEKTCLPTVMGEGK